MNFKYLRNSSKGASVICDCRPKKYSGFRTKTSSFMVNVTFVPSTRASTNDCQSNYCNNIIVFKFTESGVLF